MDIEKLNSGLMGRLPPRFANWMYKHLKEIPAVKATLYHHDWPGVRAPLRDFKTHSSGCR